MPEILIDKSSGNESGWKFCEQGLPSYPSSDVLEDGALHQLDPGLGTKAHRDLRYPGLPQLRRPVYKYVDAGHSAVSFNEVLWSDLASFCTMVAVWKYGRAGLAHIPGGGSFDPNAGVVDTISFLKLYEAIPTEIVMATSAGQTDMTYTADAVRSAVKNYYGKKIDDMKVYFVTGFGGVDWSQKCKLACDPKAGPFPNLII